MKCLLVPTDFSTAAEHALQYAAQLAKEITATVRLLHVYQLPIAMNDFPVMIVSAEEIKKNADNGLNKVREAAQKLFPDVPFETESRMGDVVQEINEACKTGDVIAIVTGTKDLAGFERFLMGNTTLSIVKHCTHPLIAVPEGSTVKAPKKIALAIDFSHIDEIPTDKILSIVQLLNAELHLVHVAKEGAEDSADHLPQALQQAVYHAVKEEDIAQGLQQFASGQNIDMLIVLPHKHSFFERLFAKENTDDILRTVTIPVLCLHE